MLRARERHVGQPQVLREHLEVGSRHVLGLLGGTQVHHQPAVARVHLRSLLVALEQERAVPEVGAVDDRVLQPLAAVHGRDLDRVGVALEANLRGLCLHTDLLAAALLHQKMHQIRHFRRSTTTIKMKEVPALQRFFCNRAGELPDS